MTWLTIVIHICFDKNDIINPYEVIISNLTLCDLVGINFAEVDEFKRLKKSLGNLKSAATPLAVPLFVPMIIIVGILLLLFFAVVGCATIAGGPVGNKHHHPMYYTGRSLMASAKLAGDVLSSEECVERISCEIMRASKGLFKKTSNKSR